MQNASITSTLIINGRDIYCPHCAAKLIRVTRDAFATRSGTPWLLDADEIPHLVYDQDCAYSGMLSVGHCSQCQGHYYVITLTLINGTDAELLDFQGGFGVFEGELLCENALCSSSPSAPEHAAWLMTSTRQRHLLVHEHSLGPYRLGSMTDVAGISGVSACGTRASSSAWVHGKELIDALKSEASNYLVAHAPR